jgi:GT2 family glycosyltransferase
MRYVLFASRQIVVDAIDTVAFTDQWFAQMASIKFRPVGNNDFTQGQHTFQTARLTSVSKAKSMPAQGNRMIYSGLPSFEVVVPAHQAADTLPRCLDSLIQAGIDPTLIIVVDDGSSDGTGDVARRAGARVLRNYPAVRPARARNSGVSQASAEVILFVDADVAPHFDAPRLLLECFREADIGAAFGSYDDNPETSSIVSKYRNLLHYFTHQNADLEAETFWSGLGAVRRERFVALGGLDPAWQDIEDVEFGLRLRASGNRIRLEPAARGTHLKEWSLPSMFRTDLWGRAVPWTRLMIEGRMQSRVLNTGLVQRMSALLVASGLLSLILMPFLMPALFAFFVSMCLFLAINLPLWRQLFRVGGPSLALGSIPYHLVHYVAALLGYAYAHIFPVGWVSTQRPASSPGEPPRNTH